MFFKISDLFLSEFANWATLYETLIGWLMPLIVTGSTIVLFWWGVQILRGEVRFHALDLFEKTFRIWFVVNLCLASGAYATNVIGLLMDLRNSLVGLMVSGDPSLNSYKALDDVFSKALDLFEAGIPSFGDLVVSGWASIIKFVSMFLCLVAIFGYTVACALELLVIDAAISVFYLLGPLFLACLAFKPIARFFDNWLSGILKYILTAVVIVGLNGIALNIMGTHVDALVQHQDAGIYMAAALTTVGYAVILYLVIRRAGAIAADLAGGFALNMVSGAVGSGAASAASMGISTASAGARMGANTAGYAAGALSNTAAGAAVAGAFNRAVNASPSQKMIEIVQSAGRATSAIGNRQSGSVGAAYNAGTGNNVGTGTISGGRPVPHMKDIQ